MPLSFLAESTAYRAFKTLLRISCDGKGWQPCQVSIPTILSALSCFAHQNLWLSPPRRENKIIAFLICLGLKFLQPSWINVLQASGKRSLPNLIPYLAMLIIGNPPSASKDHHGSPWLLDLCSSFQHFHAKVHQLAEDLAWLKWVAFEELNVHWCHYLHVDSIGLSTSQQSTGTISTNRQNRLQITPKD